MSLKSVKVPEHFIPPFQQAETYVEKLFGDFKRQPEKGTLHIGGDRYVIMRCQSLFVSWFDALATTFGDEAASEFIYNTAREIGRSDSEAFAEKQGVTDVVERLSCGPVHFAHAGWAFVDILPDSAPAPDDSYFLHYYHPNTFEAEVLKSAGRESEKTACLFSAGYSAGWCSAAFGLEVHGREIACTARGDEHCEFIMAPDHKLDEHEQKLAAK